MKTSRGAFEFLVQYVFKDSGKKDNGWVIQHVIVQTTMNGAINPKDAPAFPSQEYWEAWQVCRGHIYGSLIGENADDAGDLFTAGDSPAGTWGTTKITGKIRFIDTSIPMYKNTPNPIWETSVPVAKKPSSFTWGQAWEWTDQGAQDHNIEIKWNDSNVMQNGVLPKNWVLVKATPEK